MKTTIQQPSYSVTNVQSLPDIVRGEAEPLKVIFDKTGKDAKDYISALVQILNGNDGANAIGINILNLSSDNVGDAVGELLFKTATLQALIDINASAIQGKVSKTGDIMNWLEVRSNGNSHEEPNELPLQLINSGNDVSVTGIAFNKIITEGQSSTLVNFGSIYNDELTMDINYKASNISLGNSFLKYNNEPLMKFIFEYDQVVVTNTNWVASGNTSYPFKKNITLTYVNTTTTPIVDFKLDTISIVEDAGIGRVETDNVGLVFYSKTIPSASFNISVKIMGVTA